MSSIDLYEILQIPKDATPEQVRKAYKKKALKTHPDRLPQGATEAEKVASAEQFRLVNNAYEVLIDTTKRREYDIHGVWPPPEPQQEEYYQRPSGSRSRTYSQQYRQDPHSMPFDDHSYHPHASFSSFAFTDPFTLFDSIFGDSSAFHRPSHYRHSHRSAPASAGTLFDPFFDAQMGMASMMANMERSMFSGMGMMGDFTRQRQLSSTPTFFESLNFDGHHGSQWASESYTTTITNGATTSVHKTRDFEGNEHITRVYPDGREIYTINGREQLQNLGGYLPSQTTDARFLPPSSDRRNPRRLSPPPQPISNQTDNMRYPGPSTGGFNGTYDTAISRDQQRVFKKHHHRDTNASNVNFGTEVGTDHHDKRWYRRLW